jgi:hypothetical protein
LHEDGNTERETTIPADGAKDAGYTKP